MGAGQDWIHALEGDEREVGQGAGGPPAALRSRACRLEGILKEDWMSLLGALGHQLLPSLDL
jgi:hypothetical protein